MADVMIFAGGFGSGKSELALNYVMEKRPETKEMVLADLDLVNPYFAARDVRDDLEKIGVEVVAPSGDLSFGDVPSVPGEIIRLIKQENEMVIDLAGDEVGALVLGYLSSYIKARSSYDFFFVLNPYRPFAQDLDSVMELRELLERAASLEFTGVISNPNLLEETTLNIVREGHSKVVDFADKLKLPLICLTVPDKLYGLALPLYGKLVKPIQLYLRPEWLLDPH